MCGTHVTPRLPQQQRLTSSLAVSLSTKRLTNQMQIIKTTILETTYSKVSRVSGARWAVLPQTVSQNLSKLFRFRMFLSENCVVVGVKSFDPNISRLNIFVSFICYTSGVYRISKSVGSYAFTIFPLHFLDLNKREMYC